MKRVGSVLFGFIFLLGLLLPVDAAENVLSGEAAESSPETMLSYFFPAEELQEQENKRIAYIEENKEQIYEKQQALEASGIHYTPPSDSITADIMPIDMDISAPDEWYRQDVVDGYSFTAEGQRVCLQLAHLDPAQFAANSVQSLIQRYNIQETTYYSLEQDVLTRHEEQVVGFWGWVARVSALGFQVSSEFFNPDFTPKKTGVTKMDLQIQICETQLVYDPDQNMFVPQDYYYERPLIVDLIIYNAYGNPPIPSLIYSMKEGEAFTLADLNKYSSIKATEITSMDSNFFNDDGTAIHAGSCVISYRNEDGSTGTMPVDIHSSWCYDGGDGRTHNPTCFIYSYVEKQILSDWVADNEAQTWLFEFFYENLSGYQGLITSMKELDDILINYFISKSGATSYDILDRMANTDDTPRKLTSIFGRLSFPSGSVFHMDHQNLTGALPMDFLKMNAPNSEIYLNDNQLTGELLSSGFPSECSYLDLSGNKFSGSLDYEFLANFHGTVDLEDNQICGINYMINAHTVKIARNFINASDIALAERETNLLGKDEQYQFTANLTAEPYVLNYGQVVTEQDKNTFIQTHFGFTLNGTTYPLSIADQYQLGIVPAAQTTGLAEFPRGSKQQIPVKSGSYSATFGLIDGNGYHYSELSKPVSYTIAEFQDGTEHTKTLGINVAEDQEYIFSLNTGNVDSRIVTVHYDPQLIQFSGAMVEGCWLDSWEAGEIEDAGVYIYETQPGTLRLYCEPTKVKLSSLIKLKAISSGQSTINTILQ